MTWTSVILIASNLVSFLLLSSNDRVHSFYWIKGIKHCFLTCFSYLNSYFLILVFLHNCYLLVSLLLSWLQRNLMYCPIFSYLWDSKVLRRMCAPIFWHTSRSFLKQAACRNLVLESVPDFFPRSAFCQRFLIQTSVGQLQIIPFLLTQYPWAGTFLRDISLH